MHYFVALQSVGWGVCVCAEATDFGTSRIVTHTVELEHLSPNHTYYYRVGDPTLGWSQQFSFRSLSSSPNWTPNIGVFGDLGLLNAVSLPALGQWATSGAVDVVLHTGR